MIYITRFAPSPTGMFHLGSARTAYFNWLAARGSKGKFILRIDDTDTERNKQEYVDIILQSLEWLGLGYDEIYYQSKRKEEYVKIAKSLELLGLAKELDNGAIALVLPGTIPESFQDEVSGIVPITETNKKQIQQVILLRGYTRDDNDHIDESKLGEPTYQFASVVDDYLLKINYIIRGQDHLTNNPKQIVIWSNLYNYFFEMERAYGFPGHTLREYPKTAHVGLIHKDKKKLSKREDAASLLWYKDNGYSPNAILNFILRMGWGHPKDNNRAITKEEAADMFLEGRMRAAPSNYDLNKLNYYNKECKKRGI